MRYTKLVGVVAGLSLLVAACGDDSDSSGGATPDGTSAPITSTPVTSGPVTSTPAAGAPAADVPSAIISLSPTHTEMLFAIGAGDQVIAVDPSSNHPPEAEAKMTELSGYEPNVEAIAGYEPDLVITDGTNTDLLVQLDTLGIAHWEGPAAISFSDVYDQIEQLGAITGHEEDAAELVTSMEGDIAEILASVAPLDEPLTYYHELDPTYFSVTSDTFIGFVYSQLGLRNIADQAEGDGGSYPQLNPEFIIATDPDLIFQACTKYCGETAETMSARPGWDSIAAVQNGDVIELDDDIASRWGPRVVDFLRTASDAVSDVAARQAAG
jgi:iron complex transport system substrate-binding protein